MTPSMTCVGVFCRVRVRVTGFISLLLSSSLATSVGCCCCSGCSTGSWRLSAVTTASTASAARTTSGAKSSCQANEADGLGERKRGVGISCAGLAAATSAGLGILSFCAGAGSGPGSGPGSAIGSESEELAGDSSASFWRAAALGAMASGSSGPPTGRSAAVRPRAASQVSSSSSSSASSSSRGTGGGSRVARSRWDTKKTVPMEKPTSMGMASSSIFMMEIQHRMSR
mmetsp:Transcript_124797/g.388503  ORF Transcript_124797/g.388503 Transcript_124797/m.388503 type:complete len:228 (+) Transcript_124797:1376-2059(+)